ncbi:MAG: serine/threonine protein kinase [Planctomycetaceae bacterium]|jgi:serine/threonine-protein kinase|nr:serine/threonine protein kinase [Planctomycetaceae bacterium]
MSFLQSLFGKPRLNYRQRFELLQESRTGTMSQVYKARDKETGQLVALKILDMKKIKAVEARWKGAGKPSEGAIAVQFEHPYIVKTMEHGITTEGSEYILMEYLEGTGLDNILKVPADMLAGSRVYYVRQVAEALQEVHRKGFLHRDICPRNLIFTGDASALKLTDFGLSVPNRPPFTEPGNRTGTANYMAPELVRRKPTDIRLDVFAFGVTVYEMFTKELPWMRGDTGNAAMGHSEEPEPITTYRPQINKTIAKAVRSCIEPDAAKRCPNMETFLKMIRSAEGEDE